MHITDLLNTRFLKRWHLPQADRTIILAPAVGIVAGLGAIVFHLLCLLVTHYSLVKVVGYEQGGPKNESSLTEIFTAIEPHDPILSPWLLLIVPVVGGLISGMIVYKFAPEAEGHGTDSVIDAYHNKRGIMRARVPLVKTIASALTIGTGGSGGREGPIAQIGAGFGSYLATTLKLTNSERRVLTVAGLGAGIAAIFHAPLAGAIFAIEVLYREPDFEAESLLPAFIATTVAYCVFCLTFGFKTLFVVEALTFNNPALLLPLTALAGIMAIAGVSYVKCFYGVHRLFKKLPLPNSAKPALGAFLTGVIGLLIFFGLERYGSNTQHHGLSVLSFGYGFLQYILSSDMTHPATGMIVLLLCVGIGKALTTSLTISSGGSGGVFGPSMVIGGALGAVVGLGFHALLGDSFSTNEIRMFVILGMAGFFAAAAKTPVSTLIMVSELTGSYTLLLPSMWVCAIAYLANRKTSIYCEQVATRMDSPAHRGDFIIDILEGLTVKDAMNQLTRNFIAAPLDMPLKEMSHLLTDTRQSCFPVLDAQGMYYGMFSLNDIRQFLYDSPLADLAVAQDLAIQREPINLQMDLSDAMRLFADSQFDELPVVDIENRDKILGLLRRQDLISTYSARLLSMRSDQPEQKSIPTIMP